MLICYRHSRLIRCLKSIVILIITFSCGFIILLVRHVQVNNNASDMSGEKSMGVPVIQFTKVLTMPGGDDVPSAPPWSIPDRPIIEDLLEINKTIVDPLPPGFYVTTKFSMSPGQGNLMFQYASLFGIAWRHNATIIIPEGMLLRRAFQIPSCTVVSFRLSMHFLKNWKRQFYTQCCKYYEDTEHLENSTRFALYGYFQSYKYFHTQDKDLRKALKAEFKFLPEIENMAMTHVKAALQKWTGPEQPVLIGVHARRGLDMTWNSRNQYHGHTVARKSYFLKAMSYFKEKFRNVLFLVCSDDFYWVKQTFDQMENVYIVHSNHREVDMCVLSMCNHTIMSQGTFSWWAAYLAGGETVYYSGWPRPGSELDVMLMKEDFFLPEWIPMD